MPKLTDRIVKSLKPPAAGYAVIWDSEVHGLGVRTTSGGASFIFNYRTKSGRLRRITIGKYPAYSVEVARDVARKHHHDVRAGGDPAAEKKDARTAPDVADLCAKYLNDYAPSKRPSSAASDEMAIRLYIKPDMGSRKLVEVTFDHVVELHRKIGQDHPIRANRVVSLLSRMFNLSRRWYQRRLPTGESVPMRSDNPVKGIARNAETKRKRYLHGDELARLTAAIAGHRDKQAANIIRLLLLTGCRSGEALGARWDQFNLEDGVWTKPAATTKQKSEHIVPLSAAARQLLNELHVPGAGEFVFPGRAGVGHRVDLKRAWPEICRAAGITGLRVHDLRHSYASMLVSGGQSLPVIGALLGHSSPQTTSRYAHLMDDPLRKATETVGAIIDNAGKPGAEVIDHRRGHRRKQGG